MATATPLVAQGSLFATSYAADGQGWDVVVTSNLLSHQIHITDPFSKEQEDDLKWYLEDRAQKDPFAEKRATAAEESLEFYAKNLYEQLKPAFAQISLDVTSKQVCLAIGDRNGDESIHRLHWEALEYPALPCNICVYRTQEETNIKASKDLSNKKTSLNLLFMTARQLDEEKPDVDQRLILQPVLGFIAGISPTMPIDFDVVRPGTFEALELWLSQRKGHYDLIHFDVHGRVVKGKARLCFTSDNDSSLYNIITATKVGKLLRNAGIRVVVLNACDSAVTNSSIAANLALELLRCGISTVIGMSYNFLLRAADIFMRHFYESLLVKGKDILTSAWQARRALREDRSRQSLFGLSVDVDDSIVPVFYTQHALVQNSSSGLSDLPQIPPTQWNSVKDSNDIGSTALVGRELDTLLLESKLIEKLGFIHLYGTIGVGKTALLDDVVSWWQTTKYVRSYVAFNISEFLNQPLAAVINQLRDKVKELSGTAQHSNPDPSATKADDESRVPGATDNNILLIIDQAEDYLRVLDAENRSRFWMALGQFHDDINQLYPTLMIISSSYNEHRFNRVDLRPLNNKDALNLALETSPKILERIRKDDFEKAICYKLLDSLGGNPLAIKLIFPTLEKALNRALEHSLPQPLWGVIMPIWTEGYLGQIYEDSPALKRHFDYFLSQAEDELSKMLLTLLSPFKASVPKDLSIYFDRLTKHEALPGRLLGFEESGSLADAKSSKKLKIFEDMMSSLIFKLEETGFVIDKFPKFSKQAERPEPWTLHPLLPYMLSPKLTNFSALNAERVIKAYEDFYMARAKEWKSNSPISTIDLEHGYLNFISSFWRLRNPDGISVGAPAPWHLVNLLDGYNFGDEASKPEMVVAVALCEETLIRFQKSSGDWERSLTADLIYHPTEVFPQAKMNIEEHNKANCPCWPLIAIIVLAWRVEAYHSTRTTDKNPSSIHIQRIIDLWKLHEKHFDDNFHYQINCGVGGNSFLLVGMGYLNSLLLTEALEFLTRAQKLLQDSLVTHPMFQDQLEMCRNQIAKTEMLIANHGSRDATIPDLHDDELAKIIDKMWNSGPEITKSSAPPDTHSRAKLVIFSATDIQSALAKDISKPGSQAVFFEQLRQGQLGNLQTQVDNDWIRGQIASKNDMALAASRTKDWKQAQRLNEDILTLLDQVEYGSEMERQLKKFEYHIFAAQAAISGKVYAAAIQHLNRGYDILRSYELIHDTRYNKFKVLCMADELPKDVSHQLGGLSPIAQDLEILLLLYDPTILSSEYVLTRYKAQQDAIRTYFSKRMSGKLFKIFLDVYWLDRVTMQHRPTWTEAEAELQAATGANNLEIGQLIFADFPKAVQRRLKEAPQDKANQDRESDILYREMERALFAPPELRADFKWLDKKYEAHGLRRRWPKGYNNEKNSKQSSTVSTEPATSSDKAWLYEHIYTHESMLQKPAEPLLHQAAKNGLEREVRLLLQGGADIIKTKDSSGRTALHWAAENGHVEVVRLLLVNGADMEAKGRLGWTPLHCAAERGREAVARLLLGEGADFEAQDSNGQTALQFAAANGHEAIVQLLLQKGANAEAKSSIGWTALHSAAESGHNGVVQLLLEKGSDCEARENNGQTPLHWAAWNGHEVVVRLLLQKGANVEARGNNGYTAMLWAAARGHDVVVRLLLETEGANIEERENEGQTALQFAALNGHVAVVRLLLQKGAGIEAKSNVGFTALHYAASSGHDVVARLLLEIGGADLKARENMGQTALHWAAWNGHEAVVRLLVQKGADVDAKGNYGKTALNWATTRGHSAIVQLLTVAAQSPSGV